MRQIDWTTFPQMSYNKTVCKDEVMGGWMPGGEEDMDIFALLRLVLGLAFFLFGMNVMSSNLEKMAGGKLEQLLKTMTASPWVSLLLGAAITIAVQSSSAVTVMLVGLVNSGIMKFGQTLYVIFGANIGTTLTAWILSLSGIQSGNEWLKMLKPENFSPILAIIGVVMMMVCKNDKKKSIGTVLVGFTVLMYGMVVMSDAVSPLAEMPEFSAILAGLRNPLLGLVVATLFTAVIQSSAASVGILQALALTGSLTYEMVIPMVMGLNIGTCATSLISSIGTSYKAKRVAVIHFSIKVIGTVICLPLYLLITSVLQLDFIHIAVTPWNIAMVHTIYNLAITAILMPFTKYLVKLGKWLVKAKDETAPKDSMQYAPDLLLLRSPSVALQECDHYTFRMAGTARDSLERAISLIGAYNEQDAEVVLKQEDTLDLYEDRLDTYLVYLSAQALSQQDSRRVGKMQHAIGDFERLGDHAVNLVKAGKELEIKSLFFSEEARRELGVLSAAVREILQLTTDCYINTDHEMAHHVEPLEQVIDALTKEIKQNHLARLQAGRCSIELGFILTDLLTDYERISDHCSNIAVAVIELQHDALDSHRYLNEMKRDSDAFREMYVKFREKYTLPESAYIARQAAEYR